MSHLTDAFNDFMDRHLAVAITICMLGLWALGAMSLFQHAYPWAFFLFVMGSANIITLRRTFHARAVIARIYALHRRADELAADGMSYDEALLLAHREVNGLHDDRIPPPPSPLA